MKPLLKLLLLLLVLFLIVFLVFFTHTKPPFTDMSPLNNLAGPHTVGGFNIATPEQATQAAQDGVQVAFQYGQPSAENDELGQRLQSLHMKVVDGYISSYLYYYECHRTHTVKPPPANYTNPCTTDAHPELNSENALLANITTHLQQEKNNPLIVGFWVLDDWVPWDAGSARQLLIKIHQLI